MVFMIKLPPAVAMAPPLDTHPKDDKISLLKSLHRPYGQVDAHMDSRNGIGSEPYQNQQPYGGEAPIREDTGCTQTKPKLVMASAFLVCTCLVVFVISVTTYGRVPVEDVNSLKIRDLLEDEVFTSPLEVRVRTSCGYIVGREKDGGYSFKGIPYAKPPVGQLRWRKPVPLWIEESFCKHNQLHQATEFGSPCFQLNPYTKKFVGDEDCLYLNVWTPTIEATKGAKKHVMVYIHGGFLQFGSGHEEGLSPSSHLAKKLDVVFVSMNYRLYTMGFMSLDLLADDVLTDSRGNYGIWDQLCVLQWIKDNIGDFGGDPKKVTLFGPDSGAASIMALMASRKSQGLFRAAWLVGPTMIFNKGFPEVSIHNRALFLNRSGCANSTCMRNMSSEEVLTAHLGKDDASFRIRDQNDLPIQGIFPEQLIVVDGDLIKSAPPACFKDSDLKTVPILLGSAAQAVDFWPGPDDLSTWSWSQYKKYVTTSLDSFGLQVSKMALSIYNGTAVQAMNPNSTAECLYTTMVSDIRQFCPVSDLAKQLSQVSRYPVYRYTLKATPSKPAKIFNYRAKYAFHMWDLMAFFGELEQFIDEPTQEDHHFRDLLHRTILAFIRSGGQDVAEPDWLRYPKKSAELSQNITFGDIVKTECKFWSESGLGIYAWVS